MTGPLAGTLSAAHVAVRPPAYDLAPGQWKQVHDAFEEVATSEQGHGEVTVVFEDGRPRLIRKTISLMAEKGADFFHQLTDLVARATRRGDGQVTMHVRNHRATRVEITTAEPMVVPADVLGGGHA